MKILNLYAGIGGNRKLWDNGHQITAIELDKKRAQQYSNSFNNDTVIIADAHEYLLRNYKNFDFIWSSPPCQTHSRTNYFLNAQGIVRYPDMKLWQEIIFLQSFFKGKFCVENVIGYYKPLIEPQKIGRHYLWSNFKIPKIKQPKKEIGRMNGKNQPAHSIPIEERNAVNSELGEHILNCALGIIKSNNVTQKALF